MPFKNEKLLLSIARFRVVLDDRSYSGPAKAAPPGSSGYRGFGGTDGEPNVPFLEDGRLAWS